MEKKDLSKKLNFILKELNMNRKEFIEACNDVNSSISRPTILNAINGNSKGFPKLETIDTIIKVCKRSNNEKLKNISYDYLLNEYASNICNEDISIHSKTGLSDDAIEILHRNYNSESSVLSYLIENIHCNFWEYQQHLRWLSKIQSIFSELENLHNTEFKYEKLNNIKDLYYSFKKEQLNEFKKNSSKKDYKNYLLSELYNHDIFNNQTIEELEESFLELHYSISVDLKQVFFEFLKTEKVSEENSKSYSEDELKQFKIYYEKYCKYESNGYFSRYIDKIKEIKDCIISLFLIEYCRENFKGQHRYLKDREKYYNRIKLYKDNGIKIDYESYCDFHEEMMKFSNSLEVMNKYLRLAISEYLSEYYNNMIISQVQYG